MLVNAAHIASERGRERPDRGQRGQIGRRGFDVGHRVVRADLSRGSVGRGLGPSGEHDMMPGAGELPGGHPASAPAACISRKLGYRR